MTEKTLNSAQKHDLTILRNAAQERIWTELQDTLKRLLATLDPLIALQVGAEQAQPFLPTFEAYYPEAGWVRELLLTVVSYASAPGELPESAINQFPKPGCGNFVSAVFDLARSVQDKYTLFERYSHITNGIANSILADLQQVYFERRTAEFAFIVDPTGDPNRKTRIHQKFWRNTDVEARDTARWLAIADSVEEKILRG